ncbi:MAG: thiol reductant ABC exporter subunit CydC [Calditrichaceae bacterium]
MKNFIKLIRFAFSFKRLFLLSVLLGFLTVGSGIGLMMTSAYIIAKAALHPSIAYLQVGIVGVRFFGISRGVFRYLERLVSHDITFRLLAKFRVWFYKSIEPLAPASLMRYKSGDLLNRIVSDIESLEHIYVRVITPPVVAFLITLLMWILFGMFDLIFALAFTLCMILAGVGIPLLTHFLSRRYGRQLISVRSTLNENIIDGVQGITELLSFGQADNHFYEFNELNKDYLRLQRKMARINALHESLTALLMNFSVILMMYIAIPMVELALLDGVYLSVLILGVMAAFEAVTPLPESLQYLSNSLEASGRVFEMTETRAEIADPPTGEITASAFDLSVKNLSFRYGTNDEPALTDISFNIPEGGTLAIVGPSGAGKSTLINLLLRFWDYTEGNIRLGGKEIGQFNQEELRKFFSVISQNTYLFNESIKQNIALARPEATDSEIIRAAKLAQIHDFITRLPDGYQTYTGEQGHRLSGGERQRIAIARAYLKNAPVLILDEPTANLDVFTEQKVLESFRELSRDKTTLLITHNLNGLEKVNEIIVLKSGRIAERGPHDELIKQDSIYRRMKVLQNEHSVVEMMGNQTH